MNVRTNVPLAPLTTFALGGAAAHYVAVATREALCAALEYARARALPYQILAGGSNVLVADSGYEGVVIHIQLEHMHVEKSDCTLSVGAGASLQRTIEHAALLGFCGMEAMYGIPGSVGGAVRGNAGAFGTEMTDVVASVTALHAHTKETRTFSHEACAFGYRHSFFKHNPEWIILEVTFALTPGDRAQSARQCEATLALRNERQIQNIKSAGSFFMNPVVDEKLQQQFLQEKGVGAKDGRVPAGWLIDTSGFKDHCRDGACTGARSANYIINTGTATAAGVYALSQEIREAVSEHFGVTLQEEVTLIGECT